MELHKGVAMQTNLKRSSHLALLRCSLMSPLTTLCDLPARLDAGSESAPTLLECFPNGTVSLPGIFPSVLKAHLHAQACGRDLRQLGLLLTGSDPFFIMFHAPLVKPFHVTSISTAACTKDLC